MIEIAGGITDPQAVLDYCDAPKSQGTCNIHEFPRLTEKAERERDTDREFASALAAGGRSYRDPRIRAVFAIAPAIAVAFSPQALSNISIPVQLVAGDADPVAPVADNAEYLARHIPGSKLVILPDGVGHYTFLDACGPAGVRSVPIYCDDASGVDRDHVHERVAAMAVEFFEAHLH